jgi:hypothetical protein
MYEYPTMKQWLFHTYPQGTAAIISPETVKLHKIDWSRAKFNGAPEKFNEWLQTILAIKQANAVPDDIPAGFDRQVTEAIATHFTGPAAEAWLNTPEAMRPRNIGTNDPTDHNQTRVIPWVRHRFRSTTHELVKHQELQTVKWERKDMPIHTFNEFFKTLISEAGYGPKRPLADSFQVDWYLQTLPSTLASLCRGGIYSARSEREQLNAQLAAKNKELLPDYEPTLQVVQALAVHFNTDFNMHHPKSESSRGNTSKKRTTGSSNTRTSSRTVICYKCGEEGHVSTKCPKKDAQKTGDRFCKSCGVAHPEGKHVTKDVWCRKCKVAHPYDQHVVKTSTAKLALTEDTPTSLGLKATDTPAPPPKPEPAPLYTKGHINGHEIQLILDTGAYQAFISKACLKRVGRKIDAPSDLRIILLSGERYHPLGIVKDLELDLDGVLTTISPHVVDTRSYDVILGMNWLNSVDVQIDTRSQTLTAYVGMDTVSLPLYGKGKHSTATPKPDAKTTFLPQENLQDSYAFYGAMATPRAFPAPLSNEDYDDFLSGYVWVRLRMGQKHPTEDVSGLRCAAGRSFCRECYAFCHDCEESSNSRKYWLKYAKEEPEHWKRAAQRIINSRRSQRSPLYEECSDNWSLVLEEAYQELNPAPTMDTTPTSPGPESESDSDTSSSLTNSAYSSDPDWDWLKGKGYVSDTSTQYSRIRPKKLLRRRRIPLEPCLVAHNLRRNSDSDAEPPLLCLQAEPSTPPMPEVMPVAPDDFWSQVLNMPSMAGAFIPTHTSQCNKEGSFESDLHTPRRLRSPSHWGRTPEESSDEDWPSIPRCSCEGWCTCPASAQAF